MVHGDVWGPAILGEQLVLLAPVEEQQHQGGEEKGMLLPLPFLGLLHAVSLFLRGLSPDLYFWLIVQYNGDVLFNLC